MGRGVLHTTSDVIASNHPARERVLLLLFVSFFLGSPIAIRCGLGPIADDRFLAFHLVGTRTFWDVFFSFVFVSRPQCWKFLGFTGFSRVLPGFTEIYLVLPSFTGFYLVFSPIRNYFYLVLPSSVSSLIRLYLEMVL